MKRHRVGLWAIAVGVAALLWLSQVFALGSFVFTGWSWVGLLYGFNVVGIGVWVIALTAVARHYALVVDETGDGYPMQHSAGTVSVQQARQGDAAIKQLLQIGLVLAPPVPAPPPSPPLDAEESDLPFIGWKRLQLRETQIVSYAQQAAWAGGEVEARCHGIRGHHLDDWDEYREIHPDDMGCGIYALKERGDADPGYGEVEAQIEMWGTVHVGENTFRASNARIKKLILPRTELHEWIKERLAEKYCCEVELEERDATQDEANRESAGARAARIARTIPTGTWVTTSTNTTLPGS